MWRLPVKAGDLSEGSHTIVVKAIDSSLDVIGEHSFNVKREGNTIVEESTGGGGETKTYHDITFVSIPGGTFLMGSNFADDPDNVYDSFFDNEKPIHEVFLDGFYMCATEISQGQYQAITGENPSHFTEDEDLPVEKVNWYDAVRFCNRLSDKVGFDQCYDENTNVNSDVSDLGFRAVRRP